MCRGREISVLSLQFYCEPKTVLNKQTNKRVDQLFKQVKACTKVGNGNPLQYACLENPTDRGAWWATAHGVAESDTT